MSAQKDSNPAILAANELYWGSSQSVNKIAANLDLSKSALYDMIRPKLLGRSCPLCAEEVASSNRTAQDKRIATCPECSWEGPVNDADPLVAEQSATTPVIPYGNQDAATLDQDLEATIKLPPPEADSSAIRTMVAGACLGAAAGLALVLWTWRR